VNERHNVVASASAWMQARGWRTKLAKRRGFEQSLFEHTLIELDVVLELLPVLASSRHYSLSETEQKVLAVAVIVHDTGKETDPWQAYIRDVRPERWVPHVIPELTRTVVPELCAALGFQDLHEPVQRIMAQCADLHHNRPGRSDGAIIEAMLTGGSDRFLTLANLVKAIDHFCSAASAVEAEDAVRSDPSLGHHVKVSRHEVAVRGVSTTFLHHAARTAFQRHSWKPLLYFSNATVYGADPNDNPTLPSREAIHDILQARLDAAIAKDITTLMVGSPTGNVLPKPDLFSFDEARLYLQSAADKIKPQSLAKKPLRAKRKVVEDYWKLKGRSGVLLDDQIEQEAERISTAQPEMMVLKFFKAMMDPEKVEVIGENGAALAKQLYEEIFGASSWATLQSTSTLMPARDMARTVDYFWALPGSEVGRPQNDTVETIPSEERLAILVDLLEGIAKRVFAAIGEPSPRAALSQRMTKVFSQDLIQPTLGYNVQAIAQKQLEHYSRSKPFAGKESTKGVYLCPICNAPFDSKNGIKASADFIDNPQTHTNRAPAHGTFGYIVVCSTCYYERLLRQMLLGSRPAELITLMPRLNLGPGKGERLVSKVRRWVEIAKARMRADSGSPESSFSLSFTDQTARHLRDRDPFSLEPEELLTVFSYRFTAETQKKRRQEAVKQLKQEFDNDLDALNVACVSSFLTWDDAVDALIENRIDQQDCKSIRREVFRLYETMDLICETPNLIFIPLVYDIAASTDESETSKGLRRLHVAIILSLVFDAAVAIHKENEPVDFSGKVGAAYVPSVPAIRALVGCDWLSIDEGTQWLAAIGAAALLIRETGLPVRSALYQILATDPAEKLARRIEEVGGRTLTPHHVQLIQRLPQFRRFDRKTEEEVVR
jgi:hypothetical protein